MRRRARTVRREGRARPPDRARSRTSTDRPRCPRAGRPASPAAAMPASTVLRPIVLLHATGPFPSCCSTAFPFVVPEPPARYPCAGRAHRTRECPRGPAAPATVAGRPGRSARGREEVPWQPNPVRRRCSGAPAPSVHLPPSRPPRPRLRRAAEPEGAAMASSSFPGDLAHYGWNDRVQALVASTDEPDLVPARVLRVDRDRCLVKTATGEATATTEPLPAVGDWLLLDPTEATASDRAGAAPVVPVGATRGRPGHRGADPRGRHRPRVHRHQPRPSAAADTGRARARRGVGQRRSTGGGADEGGHASGPRLGRGRPGHEGGGRGRGRHLGHRRSRPRRDRAP